MTLKVIRRSSGLPFHPRPSRPGCPCPVPQGWVCCREPWGQGFNPEPRRWGCCGGDAATRRQITESKKIILKFKDLMDFLLFLGLPRYPSPHSLLQSLPFRMGLSITCLSHCCILDAHTYLVSQGHCWKNFASR